VALAIAGLPAGVTAAFATNLTSRLQFCDLGQVEAQPAARNFQFDCGTRNIRATTSPLTSPDRQSRSRRRICIAMSTRVSSEWPGGFGAAIHLNNTAEPTAISNWTLTCDLANGTDRHAVVEWKCNPEWPKCRLYNESYNGQYSIRRQLFSELDSTEPGTTRPNSVPPRLRVNAVTCVVIPSGGRSRVQSQ